MAKVIKGLYVPESKDITSNGGFVPDPKVSLRRFVPDGLGGGTLYITKYVQRKGFRTLTKVETAIRKEPFIPAMGNKHPVNDDHGDDERRHAHGS